MSDQTVEEFLERLSGYKVTSYNTVVIHPAFQFNFIELNVEFLEQLKSELRTKLMMAQHGIDNLDAITKFAIMVLEDSY